MDGPYRRGLKALVDQTVRRKENVDHRVMTGSIHDRSEDSETGDWMPKVTILSPSLRRYLVASTSS